MYNKQGKITILPHPKRKVCFINSSQRVKFTICTTSIIVYFSAWCTLEVGFSSLLMTQKSCDV